MTKFKIPLAASLLFCALSSTSANASPIRNVSQQQLDKICMIGPLMNAQNGRGKGYAMFIGTGKLANGTFTQKDMNAYRSYIMNNCPEAW